MKTSHSPPSPWKQLLSSLASVSLNLTEAGLCGVCLCDWQLEYFIMRLMTLLFVHVGRCVGTSFLEAKQTDPISKAVYRWVHIMFFPVYNLVLLFFFEISSQMAQTGLQLKLQERMTLSFWSPCLHLSSTKIAAAHLQPCLVGTEFGASCMCSTTELHFHPFLNSISFSFSKQGLCSPGWPQTLDPLTSTSQVFGMVDAWLLCPASTLLQTHSCNCDHDLAFEALCGTLLMIVASWLAPPHTPSS